MLFDENSVCDILSVSAYDTEEEQMLNSKYHDCRSIYLYGAFEQVVAGNIIQWNFQNIAEIKLYETPQIAKAMANNIQNIEILKIAVNTFQVDKDEWYYDKFITTAQYIRKRYALSVNDFIAKATFVRNIVKVPNEALTVIEYTLKNSNHIVSVQYI